MHCRLITLLLGITLLVGCTHTRPIKPIPAVVEHTTPTMKAELQQAIVSLKGGIAPLLSDTVFMNNNELLLEYGRPTEHSGNPILDQHSLTVQRFVLQLREVGCVLFYPKTTQFVLLKSVSCQPMIKKSAFRGV